MHKSFYSKNTCKCSIVALNHRNKFIKTHFEEDTFHTLHQLIRSLVPFCRNVSRQRVFDPRSLPWASFQSILMWLWLYQSLQEQFVLSTDLPRAHRLSLVCTMLKVPTILIKVDIADSSFATVGLSSFPLKDGSARMIQMAVSSLWIGFLGAQQMTSVKVMK